MTAPNMLQRLLDGQPAPHAPMAEELGRLAQLAAVLHADARGPTVTMSPGARAQLRNRLLAQASPRPAPATALEPHEVAGRGAAAVSRCGRSGLAHPRQAAR